MDGREARDGVVARPAATAFALGIVTGAVLVAWTGRERPRARRWETPARSDGTGTALAVSGLILGVALLSERAPQGGAGREPARDLWREPAISNGLNARPRNETISQTGGGLPDDTSSPIEISDEEERRIAERILSM